MASFAAATLTLDGPSGSATAKITSGSVTLGRTPENNDFVVPDPAASGRHCSLVVDKGVLLIRDLGSSNGTFVNGQRIVETALHDGDVVRIGQTQGRIQVVGSNGKPLRAAASRGPILAVVAVVGVLLAAGGGYFVRESRQREAEHTRFADYEKKAAELLAQSPCQAVSKIQLDYFGKHDADAARVTPADRAVAEEVLGAAHKREEQAREIVGRLIERIAARKTAAEELSKVKSQLTEPSLLSAVAALDDLFSRQRQMAEDYQKAWQDYGAAANRLAASVDKYLHTDPLPAQFVPEGSGTSTPAAKLFEGCEASFRETKAKGLARLAALAQ